MAQEAELTEDVSAAELLRRIREVAEAEALSAEDLALLTSLEELLRSEESSWPHDLGALSLDAESLWTHFERLDLTLTGNQRHVQLMGIVWAATVFRQARSAFLLVSNGLADAAVPNVRTALEHAVYLSLISSSEDAGLILDVLEREFREDYERIFADAARAGDDPPDEIRRLVSSLPMPEVEPKDTRWPENLREVCDRLHTGPRIYYHYRWLCTALHPGLGVLANHLPSMMAPEALAEGRFSPQPMLVGPGQLLYFATASCVWTAWSLDDLGLTEDFSSLANPIAARRLLSRLSRVRN